MSLSASALCDLSSLKRWLSIRPSQADQDPLLEELIETATAIIERSTSRRLKERVYVNDLTALSPDGSQRDIIWLLEFPVASVQLVNLGYGSGDLAPSDYVLYKDAGYIRMARRITFSTASPGPENPVPAGVQNVRVDFTAGFNPIPPDLRQACRDLAAHMFTHSPVGDKRGGLVSRSIGDKAESYIADATIPPRIEQLIAPYRRVSLISHREEEQ